MRHPIGAASCCASSACPHAGWAPVPHPQQEIATTPSRRAGPRVWLAAVAGLVAAGLHSGASGTTLRVARDLARRMGYLDGTVLYDLEGTAARCELSVATVKRHVAVLRSLGALVWVRHGTRANLRLPGRKYAGTATIYAAAIPPVWDAMHGRLLDGTGYGARVVGVSEAGRRRAVDAVVAEWGRKSDSVTSTGTRPTREPQSPGRHHHVRTVRTSRRLKDTSRRRAPRATGAGRPRSARRPQQVARDISLARQVRPLVPWTQREGLRRLAYSLRPLVDRGLDGRAIAAELQGLAPGWRPQQPAAFITAALAGEAGPDAAPHATVESAHSEAWQGWLTSRDTQAEPVRTDDDRRYARLYGWDRWRAIATHYEDDPDDALDLYGRRLCAYAVGRDARS